MSPAELADLLERETAEMTPGEWAVNHCRGTDGGDECWQEQPHQDIYAERQAEDGGGLGVADITGDHDEAVADSRGIVALRNHLPAILAALRAPLDVDRLTQALDNVTEYKPEAAVSQTPGTYWTSGRVARAIAAEYARLAAEPRP